MPPHIALLSALSLGLTAPPAPLTTGVGPVAAEAVSIARERDAFALWQSLVAVLEPRSAAQVRIEQHLVLRIVPMPGPARQHTAALGPPGEPLRLSERKAGKCVRLNTIAGGRPASGSRLLLFMRDRKLMAADLEKACSARDFYRGFYVDKPHADGQLCADRDRVLSRSGVRCEIDRFRMLVAED